jgi:hypothetical protein
VEHQPLRDAADSDIGHRGDAAGDRDAVFVSEVGQSGSRSAVGAHVTVPAALSSYQ